MEEFEGKAQAKLMKTKLGDLYPYADMLEKVKSMNGIQARLLPEIEFK